MKIVVSCSKDFNINEGVSPAFIKAAITEGYEISVQLVGKVNNPHPSYSPLTPAELRVMDCLLDGYGNKHIATELGISFQTVKNHCSAIMKKYDCTNRTEAVMVHIGMLKTAEFNPDSISESPLPNPDEFSDEVPAPV